MVGRAWLLALIATLGLLALSLPRAPLSCEPAATGVVLSEEGPVASAVVRIKGSARPVHTDVRGRFHLPAAPADRITAWKEGFFIAGGRMRRSLLSLHLERLPAADHEAYQWVSPVPKAGDDQRCGNCHREIYREWAGGGHARSATGRHFLALYDDLLRERPLGADVCASCHAPTAEDGDLRKPTGSAALGVHCDYCHKVSGQGPGEIGLAHGRFLHALLRPAKGQLFFGPLDDVDRGEDAYSPYYRDSRYCAACHEGVVFGTHVYGTYSEWLQSPARRAGQQCQDCHMKPTGRLTNIAPGRGGIPRDPNTLANHVFWDGSQREMLKRSIRVAARLTRDEKSVRANVTLTAEGVGHRVPTGFPERHLVLVVEGVDANGKAVDATGGARLAPEVGPSLAGKGGKLYARVLRDERGRGPVSFWQGVPDEEDTRLTPGVADQVAVTFPAGARQVRVRLVHRRFWETTVRAKGWPVAELVIVDRIIGGD